MTDAERLKVAEEKVRIAKELCDYKNTAHRETFTCVLSDVSLRWNHDAATKKKEYIAQRTTKHEHYTSGGGPDLASSECPVEAIYLARQKLAAEREAAMTPSERKKTEALQSILRAFEKCPYDFDSCRSVVDIARKALEEA